MIVDGIKYKASNRIHILLYWFTNKYSYSHFQMECLMTNNAQNPRLCFGYVCEDDIIV